MGDEQHSAAGAKTRSASSRQIVLVVDDDEDIAASIADVLRSKGHDARTVGSGADALAVASASKVGLVLLDWRLPDEPAGAALVRKLRDVCGLLVPVVVLSADPMSLAEARGASVSDYLPKPFEIDDLLHLVESYF